MMVMDTDRFNDARDETLIKRRPWYVLAVALLILSAITRQPIAFLAAIFALVIGIVPELWYRSALRNLVIHQRVNQKRAFFGEAVMLSVSVENQKLLPLPWLEVEDEIPIQLPLLTGRALPTYKVNRMALVNTFSLWSFQRVTRRYQLGCNARGVFRFGPAVLRSGDPFGWLLREERVPARVSLLIYPLVAPIESFGLPPRHPFGERTTPRRLLEDPLRVAGVREYIRGDDPRRIHWKAPARAGELRSKIYEPSSQYRLLMLLDINTYPESWMGLDPEIQELTIAAAASIAMWALDEGYTVGLLANSLMIGITSEHVSQDDEQEQASRLQSMNTTTATQTFVHRVRIPMASDSGQREQLLSALGRLLPYFGSPMDALIEAERFTLPLGTTVVLVSAAAVLREITIEHLVDIRTHGAVVHLALTGDAGSTVGTDTYDLPVHHIGGREVWHELVTAVSKEKPEYTGRSAKSLYLD
jgi:uncharacterized protein (DUF58 family)